MDSESKPTKAREFLMTVEILGDGLFRLFFNKFVKPNNFTDKEQIHVIEKSAYDKAVEALKHIGNRDAACGPCNYRVPESDPEEHLRQSALKTLKDLGEASNE